jgi:hypothetical protein
MSASVAQVIVAVLLVVGRLPARTTAIFMDASDCKALAHTCRHGLAMLVLVQVCVLFMGSSAPHVNKHTQVQPMDVAVCMDGQTLDSDSTKVRRTASARPHAYPMCAVNMATHDRVVTQMSSSRARPSLSSSVPASRCNHL